MKPFHPLFPNKAIVFQPLQQIIKFVIAMNNAGCFDMATFYTGFCNIIDGTFLLDVKVDI